MTDADLRQTFTLANAFKEGDLLVGGTPDEQIRAEARRALAAVRIGDLIPTAFVDDGVSEALARRLDRNRHDAIAALTCDGMKAALLGERCAEWVSHYRDGLTSEAIAAVVKLMTNDELSHVAHRLFNALPGPGLRIGSPGYFGSRIQPNSPGDDEEEILFSILEGLAYGCGDVILGLNPAADDLDTIVHLEALLARVVDRLQLPTRYCVLSDMVKQHRARERVAVDVGFQSLAGTSRALVGMVGLDVDGLVDLARAFGGLYFETGQGSAVTNGTAEGVDMVTLEARAYGVARHIRAECGVPWVIVNDVAGFIGPEVFRSADQLERACLEDVVMAKLHGLTMGLDVCATFHMGIDPATLDRLTAAIVDRAAPAYLMAVAGNADPMLGYLTTSFRDHPRLRQRTQTRIATAMHDRLRSLGALGRGDLGTKETTASLYAAFAKAGGDHRTTEALCDEALLALERLRERGYDLAYGCEPDGSVPPFVRRRLEAIYEHARRALYARLDEAVVADVSPHHVAVSSNARDREDYLAHPPAGERVRPHDVPALMDLRTSEPEVQIVFSDGLNANALNENLRRLVPRLRRELTGAGCHAAATDVVMTNGRVRAGYHAAALIDPAVLIHVIGERPGTGLNTASAYITYGRDATGRSRWTPDLDHSCTAAVCGINVKAKPPETAAGEIVRVVRRAIDERRSGVAPSGP